MVRIHELSTNNLGGPAGGVLVDERARAAAASRAHDGEKVLWAGRPDPLTPGNKWDVILSVFAIGWIVVWWVAIRGTTPGALGPLNAKAAGVLCDALILAAGLWLLLLGRIAAGKLRARTVYAVTNMRVFALTAGGSRLSERHLGTIDQVRTKIRPNGAGTLELGTDGRPVVFADIQGAGYVADLVNTLQRSSRRYG